jgi:hypothetical protein
MCKTLASKIEKLENTPYGLVECLFVRGDITVTKILKHYDLSTFTYLLTSWISVLLEKLTDSQLVKKFPVLYGTRSFINAFTSAHHLSLS